MSPNTLKTWWGQRPTREKVLLVAVVLGVLAAGGDGVVTAPLEKQLRREKATLATGDPADPYRTAYASPYGVRSVGEYRPQNARRWRSPSSWSSPCKRPRDPRDGGGRRGSP